MNEAALIEKLIKIEALFAGAATEGERASADRARQRILKRLAEIIPEDPPVEYKFTFRDMWSRKVFVALLRRYNLTPYRYHRQRYTTVMVQVPERFVSETLWPEFQEINVELNAYLQEVTDRVIKQVLHEDSSEATVVDQPFLIPDSSGLDSKSTQTTNTEAKQSQKTPKGHHSNKKKKRKKKNRKR